MKIRLQVGLIKQNAGRFVVSLLKLNLTWKEGGLGGRQLMPSEALMSC